MDSKVNYAAVGMFVLVLSAALIAGILWLAVGAGNKKHYEFYMSVMDESVAGLNVDASVKYMGVDVGKVSKIQIDPSNPLKVQLIFAIEKGTPIKEDTEAVLKAQGLTGITYVELSGSSPNARILTAAAEGQLPIIRSKPSLSARLENVLTRVLANLDRTAANVNAMFDEDNRAEVKKILSNTSKVMGTIASQKEEIARFIASAAKTANSTASAAPHIDPMLKRISTAAESVQKMANEATLASTNAKTTLAEVGSGVRQFTGETLPEMERLLGELNVLSASLQRLSEQTERNPSSLLRGRQPVPMGPGEKVEP
ncbi:MAG: MlaD family protein [Undibacterium sp.]|uniref:MlaD family protein n=1 Tax=Undibacterium sp. TaxID=1914977 RepID=UPI002717CD2A|nr:MlaD family protein [Undibacterium sp.]MDO8653989.1 MlaD family protein [Undibacterium sp.]